MARARRALRCLVCLIGCARSTPPGPAEPAPALPVSAPATGGHTSVGPAASRGEPPGVAAGGSGAPVELTASDTHVTRRGPPRLLRAVRAASGVGYDRVVFEFQEGLPGYRVEYVEPPIVDCGAGNVKELEGAARLEVRLEPANAHTEEGQPTVSEREVWPRLPVIREIERTCDFEAVVTYVVGAASPNRYRVFELGGPPRVIIDIEH